MSNVFTAQLPVQRNKKITIDTTPALEYGSLSLPCLEGNLDIEHDAKYISKRLEVYFSTATKNDYLILCGEIAIFALALSILLKKTGGANILKWNYKTGKYVSTYVEL